MSRLDLSLPLRLLTTPYKPQPKLRHFLSRAQTQQDARAEATVAVLDAAESEQVFGVPLARRGLQPVYVRITNRGATSLRLQLVSVSPNYYTPLEAAALNHYSIFKRLSAFGFVAWAFFPLLAIVVPIKWFTAQRANRRIDECFQALGFHLRPIPPGETSEGFIFTPLDAGTKVVHICLHGSKSLRSVGSSQVAAELATSIEEDDQPVPAGEDELTVDFTFSILVPGISADYLRRDLAGMHPQGSHEDCNQRQLVERLEAMPAATANHKGTRHGDPVNLVVIGEFEHVIGAFAARWDESETITLSTCWKTMRSFLLGSQYRYSPVSPLYLFGRSQDLALQRSRRSINERLHLRLWLTPLRFLNKPVWVGQVSRDIGVRFTFKTWNLTTHRIDPDVDEARDYVIEDLLAAQRLDAAGYVAGAGGCDHRSPRHNLTGDPYFTDGKRAVILLSAVRRQPRFIEWD